MQRRKERSVLGARAGRRGQGEKETSSEQKKNEPTLHGGRVSMCAGQWYDGEGVGFNVRKAGYQSRSVAH